MLSTGYVPPIWVGFWVKNSLNKCLYFVSILVDFPQTWVGFPEIGKKLSKMGTFPPKFIIKVGIIATVGN